MPDLKTTKVELWDGYSVDVNEQLMDDYEFVADLNDYIQKNNIVGMYTMAFALVGGQEVFEKTKEHIVEEKGYFSEKELQKIIKKIIDCFPKVGGGGSKSPNWMAR